MRSLTVLSSMSKTCYRTSRYGDFVIVTLQGGAIAVGAQDLQQAESWARSRTSSGIDHRDRETFINRFETLLARTGSGIASKGSRPVLARMIKGMEQSGIQISEWSVPHNVNESVEMKKPAPAQISKLQEPQP